MDLYDKNGYIDISKIYNRGICWQLICGGRATGKSYGALQMCIDENIKFLYLRRTQAVVDLLSNDERHIFKSLNTDRQWDIQPFSLDRYTTGFWHTDQDPNGKTIKAGSCLGYMAALSTFSNLRGFDGSDITLLIYDEFIPEKHEKRMKNEYEALLNAYETINRNRELQGRPALRVLALANSNDIANPLFMGLDLVKRAVRMKQKNVDMWEDPVRGLGLYFTDRSPISAAKAETALYKLTRGSDFEAMSLHNDFSHDKTSTSIRSRPLRDLIPIVSIGELCIYQGKGDGFLYASTHVSGNPERYLYTPGDAQRFRHKYGWISVAYLNRQIECEDYLSETLLTNVLYKI